MRRRTRNVLGGLIGVVVVLLALGAVPGLLRAGDPYYLTATPAASTALAPTESVNATALSGRRYPFTTAALANASGDRPGRSPPYWRGPVGIKGAFTHSPFDELAALRGRAPNATDGDAVVVRRTNATYRLTVDQEATA